MSNNQSTLDITTLENGFKVLFYKTKNKATNISVYVKVGEVNSTPESRGVAHFVEHLILENSKNYKDSEEINFAVNKFGGDINAMVDQEETGFFVNILNKHYKEGIKVLADCIQNPLFLEAGIEKERKVILNEAILSDEDFDDLMQRKLLEKMYTNSPFSINVIGKKSTIKTISREQILDFYNKHYVPNNMFIVITGDIEDPLPFIKEQFVFKKGILDKQKKPILKKQVSETIKLSSKLVDSTKGLMCYDLPLVTDKYLTATSMFYLVLNNFKGGVLLNHLRAKFGIYDSMIFQLRDEDHAMVMVDFSIRDTDPEVIFTEINDFLNNLKFSEEEFLDMKNFFKSSIEMLEDSSRTISTILANYELKGIDPRRHLNIDAEVDKILLSDFNKVKGYFASPAKLILEKAN
ncbi:MAG: pitrilysin family protein [archaeon]|jgi:predicted Zn-dependent peptidase